MKSKRIISAVTAAALTFSMLSVSSVVCTAEEAGSSVSIVIQDETIEKGTATVTVPVTVTENTTITSAEFELSAAPYPMGTYKAKIVSAESGVEGLKAELKYGKVTLSGSEEVKKGQELFSVTVEIQDFRGDKAASIPDNMLFKLKADSVKINGKELSDTEREKAAALLFAVSDKVQSGSSFVIDSVNTVSKTVRVPVTVKGSYNVFRASFRASDGAVIKSVDVVEETKVEPAGDESIVFADMMADTNTVFDNCTVAYLNVELPDDAVSGQSFQITARMFDGYDIVNSEAVIPDSIVNSDIVYVKKGDISLNNTVDQLDSTYSLRELLSIDLCDESILYELYDMKKNNNDVIRDTIEKCGEDKLALAAREALDIDGDDKMSIRDTVYILRYLLYTDLNDSDITIDEYMNEFEKE